MRGPGLQSAPLNFFLNLTQPADVRLNVKRYAPRQGVNVNPDGRSLITLTGVTKVFTTDEVETHALAGIELVIEKGEYVSISGPSGCGKSTLLAILGLLDTPSDG